MRVAIMAKTEQLQQTRKSKHYLQQIKKQHQNDKPSLLL